jgi:hypothetical protein
MENSTLNISNKENKREYWATHIKQWEESKLSQTKYCKQVGISYSTFVYWKGLLLSKLLQTSKKQFVPVKVIPNTEPTANAAQSIEIRLLAGHVVSIPTHLDIKAIATLINLLGVSHA